jgi:DNA invertase Pin-like site-specific DNA recombinase
MRRMVDAFAEYERLLIGARTKAALRAKMAKGERVGSVPFGKRLAADGVKLLPDPEEEETIERIKSLRASKKSLRSIAAKLDELKIKPKGGSKQWHFSSVNQILQRTA